MMINTTKKSMGIVLALLLIFSLTGGCDQQSLNISIDPPSIEEGEAVTITVTGTFTSEIVYQRLTINGDPQEEFRLGQEFFFTPEKAGVYHVKVFVIDEDFHTGTGSASFEVKPLTNEEPHIVIDGVSDYGDEDGYLWGRVSGVNPSEYMVLGYIRAEDVWWTKPYYNSPSTLINPDGSWELDITTGGNDRCATRVMVFLVPIETEPLICDPCHETPDISSALDEATIDRTPQARIIPFAGYEWKVKQSDCPAGPGPNLFSDRSEDVWADEDGLHLTIKQHDDEWWCTEVINSTSLGYGTYTFLLNSRVDLIDPNMVLGLFTWDTKAYEINYRELDIEFAQWSDSLNDTNGQCVVQPCSQCPGCADNCSRFQVDLSDQDKYLTAYLIWTPDEVRFRIYRGTFPGTTPPASSLIHKWVKTGEIPEPGDETIRFNFWLFNSASPSDGLEDEVIINDFSWQEAVPDFSECGDGFIDDGEECDDGNTADGDGCSSTCEEEDISEPAFFIDGVSPYGTSDGWVWGEVFGYSPDDFAVVVYIKVRNQWWTKPYWNQPVTFIQADGTWRCDIVTGGVDHEALEIRAYLIPIVYDPPLASGSSAVPATVEENAIDMDYVERNP